MGNASHFRARATAKLTKFTGVQAKRESLYKLSTSGEGESYFAPVKPNSGRVVFDGRKGRLASTITGFVNVTDYRLYALDGVDKVASGEWFEADDDDAAIEAARTMMDGRDCELWQAKRFVARIQRRRGD